MNKFIKTFLLVFAAALITCSFDLAHAQEDDDLDDYVILSADQILNPSGSPETEQAASETGEEVDTDALQEAEEDVTSKDVEEEYQEAADADVEFENNELHSEVEEDAELEPEAEPEPESKKMVDMEQLITLDLRGMDVADALTYISLRSGANIVASKAVTGRVTLQLKDVPLRDVFDITLLTNNLAFEKFGDIFYIMTEAEYEARYGKKFSDIRQVKIIQLQYAIPEKAFDLLDTLKSNIGRILVDQQSGAVLIVDTKEKIEEMESALATLEKKSDMNIFSLQYANASDVETQLRTQLDDINVGSIWSDERNNQVVVRALAERMTDVEELISALDKKTLEVLVDTKLIKITLSDTLETGFEWEGLFQSLFDRSGGGFFGSHPVESAKRTGEVFIDTLTQNNNTKIESALEGTAATQISNFPFVANEDANLPAGSKRVFGEQIFFGTVDKNHSFEVLMKFLATLGETRLLSNPKIAVTNNQEARIHVGRQEAYITSTTTAGTSTTTTAEDVTFIDVGIQLSVTPTINEEGYITMKIKPEVSSVVDTLVTPSGNRIPILDTSLAETTVMVKDNATIIIGGLRRQEEMTTAKRIPFFGDLPILGGIFRSQIKVEGRSELLVMITPHIVDGALITSGEFDETGKPGTKEFMDYDDFGPTEDTFGPDFGQIEYKSFRE